jgi:hypothetical protein
MAKKPGLRRVRRSPRRFNAGRKIKKKTSIFFNKRKNKIDEREKTVLFLHVVNFYKKNSGRFPFL